MVEKMSVLILEIVFGVLTVGRMRWHPKRAKGRKYMTSIEIQE
jgi:uncharacterized membrane protein SirB2